MSDPGAQLQKVIDFKKKIVEEKSLLFQNFDSGVDFASLIRKCISNYVLDHVDLNDTQPQATHIPEAEVDFARNEISNIPFDYGPVRGESAKFIHTILQRRGDASNRGVLVSFEVARLRLISNALGDSQNDSAYLGAHDANLIYRNKDACTLDDLELLGLLQSGAKNLQYENIPLWYWLKCSSNKNYKLSYLTLTIPERDDVIVSSILELMTLTGTEIETDELMTRDLYVSCWLSKTRGSSVRNAALRYLKEKGVESDLVQVQKEIDKNSSQTIAMAHEAYVAIKLRGGLSAGLKAVNDLQSATLGSEIVDKLFEGHSHITTEELYKAAENRNKTVRVKAIEILLSRDLLPFQKIELIQQDPEPSVRALAIPALLKQGANLSEDEARAIIIKDKEKPTNEESLAWSRFQPKILSMLESAELQRRMQRLLPLNSDAYFELARRKIDAWRSELTKDLLDKYEVFYNRNLRLWAEASNADPDAILKQFDTLKQFVKADFVRKTLDVLVENKSKKDLSVIRNSLADPAVFAVEADIQYFYMFGTWQDAPLVVELVKRFKPAVGATMLGGFELSKETTSLAVKTILKLGKDRIADVLLLDCPSNLKRNIISSIKDREFVGIGDDVVLGILIDADSEVRKHCALKCAKTYSRERLIKVLNEYYSINQVFYNVVHWFDFGLHGSRDQIKSVCKKIFIF